MQDQNMLSKYVAKLIHGPDEDKCYFFKSRSKISYFCLQDTMVEVAIADPLTDGTINGFVYLFVHISFREEKQNWK